MSHRATNWAMQQRGLTPASWRVLLQLADRHNGDTGRCDPSQSVLAYDCEMSRASINRHLGLLESRGLIRRIQRLDPKTQRQCSTSYELAISGPFPVSQDGTRSVSQNRVKPCLNSDESRVSNCDTNPVREPGREPCDEPDTTAVEGSDRIEVEESRRDDREFDRFMSAHPKPLDEGGSRKAWRAALASGEPPERIIHAAEAYARDERDNDRRFVKGSANWLREKRWKDCRAIVTPPAIKRTSLLDTAKFWAETIREGRYVAASAISCAVARVMVGEGLVSQADLRAIGVMS